MKNSFLICITCFNNSSIEQCALIILVTVQMQQVTPDFTLTHVLLAEIKVVGTPAHNPNKQTNKHCVLLWLWNNLYISDLSHETVQSRGEKHHCHGLPAAQGTAQLLQEGGGPVHQQGVQTSTPWTSSAGDFSNPRSFLQSHRPWGSSRPGSSRRWLTWTGPWSGGLVLMWPTGATRFWQLEGVILSKERNNLKIKSVIIRKLVIMNFFS